jgi:hypothetical protein
MKQVKYIKNVLHNINEFESVRIRFPAGPEINNPTLYAAKKIESNNPK